MTVDLGVRIVGGFRGCVVAGSLVISALQPALFPLSATQGTAAVTWVAVRTPRTMLAIDEGGCNKFSLDPDTALPASIA